MREGSEGYGLATTLFRGSATFLGISVLGSGISFVVHLYMAREAGAKSYGLFVYATGWMAILLLGCHIGLRSTVVRFVAAYKAHGKWGLLRGLLRSSTRWTLVASVVTSTVSLGSLWLVRPRLDELGATLVLVAAAMPFMALSDVWSSAVRGFGAVARSQVPASIVQHALTGIAFTTLVMVGGTSGNAVYIAGAFLFATIGSLIVAGRFLRMELPDQMRASQPGYCRREWADVAGSNGLIAIFQAVRVPLIVVISGAYVDSQHLAFYGVAHRLANMLSLALLAISGFVSPLISQYYALGRTSRLQQVARLSALGALGCALVPALVLTVFGRELLGIFGEGFESAYETLLVLVLGELVAAAAGPVGFLLTMTGRHKVATWIEAISSVIVLGLALALIPRHGILGAAIVVATGSMVRNIAMSAAAWRGLRAR